MRKDPWGIREWHYVQREAALIRQLLGSGATAIGKANYADKKGLYYVAFFGLTAGVERLAKLCLVIEHAIKNSGTMPPERLVRSYGHDLSKLLDRVERLSTQNNLEIPHERPVDEISNQILLCLNAFADASRGRYANFGSLSNPQLGAEEPISKWWGEVAELILNKHFRGTRAEQRVRNNAQLISSLLSPHTMVRMIDESGNVLDNVFDASARTGETEVVQKYGRFYSLSLVRWIAEVFSDLAKVASEEHTIDAFYGAWEHLYDYTLDDSFLKSRKVWPLT